MQKTVEILHQTRDYIVVFKPSGMLSQSAPNEKEDVVTLLSKMTGCPIYPIHRLDRFTSGVMVYACNQKAAGRLSASVASGQMQKQYLAICHGLIPEQGEMVDLLLHRNQGNKSFVVDRMRAGVKEARLTYRRLASVDSPEELSLVRVFLETGRTHQIRVQFAHRGHPLYGDGKYGAHSPGHPSLFCEMLAFPDPNTGKTVQFSLSPQGGMWEVF